MHLLSQHLYKQKLRQQKYKVEKVQPKPHFTKSHLRNLKMMQSISDFCDLQPSTDPNPYNSHHYELSLPVHYSRAERAMVGTDTYLLNTLGCDFVK